MNAHHHSLKITLATAAAALLLGVAQFAAIDKLAAPRNGGASAMPIVQLPPVIVIGQAERAAPRV